MQLKLPPLLMPFFVMVFCFSASFAFGQATVKTDKADYLPGDVVQITGDGWQPGEQVKLDIDHSTISHGNTVMYAKADSNGHIYNNQYVIQQIHLGESFVLSAVGESSGLTAKTTFTDGNLLDKISVSQQNPASVIKGNDATYTVTVTRKDKSGAFGGTILSITSTLPQGVTAKFSPSTIDFSATDVANNIISKTSTLTLSTSSASSSSPFTVQAYYDKNDVVTNTGSLTVSAISSTNLVVNAATGTYGGTAELKATLITGNPASGVSGKTISFSLNGGTAITATTNSSGVAIIPAASLSGINANTYATGVSASFAGDVNFAASSATNSLVVNKADQAISWTVPSAITYGTALNDDQLNASVTTGNGALTYSPASGTVLAAGPHTLSVTAAETANYKEATATVSLQVNKATPVITWSNPDGITYGTALSGTQLNANAGSVAGTFTYTPDLGTVLNAGNGQTLSVNFTPADAANYNTPATKTVTIDVEKATASISLSGLTGQTYNGSAKQVTVATTPAGLSGLSVTYNGAATAPVNAGSYAVVVTLTNDNYKAESQSGTFIINQADATIRVTGYSGTYDGNAHGATGTATGVNDENLSSLLNLGNSFTDYPGGTANWSFAGNTNYKAAGGNAAIVIDKATPSITLTIGNAPTYDGNAHYVQSATVSGVGGNSLGNATVVYRQDAAVVEHPINAGSYSVTASYAGSNNYKAAEPQTGTLVINKADADVNVTGYSGTYDANEHGASGDAKGTGGITLGGLDLGAKFKNAPGGTAQWTFDGGINYNNQSGSVAITINKADATINITSYSGVYDGNAHGASGSATGVEGEDLSGLNLGTSFTDVPGGTANWTFTDATGNYNNKSGSVQISISKADQVITWANPANIIYGTALGNDQLNATALGGAVLTYTPAAGTVLGAGSRTLSVSAAETNNYNAASKDVTLVVEKATATISLSNLNHVYDGEVKNATATTTPSGLSGVNISNNGKTDAGSYEVEATLSNDNYKAEPVKGSLFIDQATTSIGMENVSGITGGFATVTASITPALSGRTISFTLNGDLIGTTVTNTSGVATLNTPACTNNGTVEASFAGERNYKASSKTATLSIVAPTYTWNGVSTTPIQLAGSGVTVTPVVNFAGVTLTNATFDWDNGKGALPVSGTLTDKYAPGSFTYTTPGVYAPKLVGKDACGNPIIIRLEYLVIYDPNGGFVTGGGWINSPAGAYKAEPSSEGKATFGFVAKYKKGSTSIVEGETEFQFHAGNLKFNSTAYDNVSLVVGGAKASYKGTGTINGAGSYKFMLTAIDGQVTGGGGQDKIRMKITDAAGIVVYDNMMDALDNATPTTVLQGGSIVIHEAKATKSIDASQTLQLNRLETTESSQFNLQAFPNPSAAQFNLKLESNIATEKITIRVVDMHGRTVQLLHNLVAGQTIQIGNDYRPGVYIVEMVQGNNRKQIKLLKQPN